MPKCYTCQEDIAFDKNILSKTGKQIPLTSDKKYTHGHDEDGNPIRKPLPNQSQQTDSYAGTKTREWSERITPQQQPQQQQQQQKEYTPTDVPAKGSGGTYLDTKRILQTLIENTKEIRDLRQELKSLREELSNNTNIDTHKLIGQLQTLGDIIAPFLNTQIKTGKELYEDSGKQDPSLINHAKRAEEYQNAYRDRRKTTDTKFLDESKEKIPQETPIHETTETLLDVDEDSEEGVSDDE